MIQNQRTGGTGLGPTHTHCPGYVGMQTMNKLKPAARRRAPARPAGAPQPRRRRPAEICNSATTSHSPRFSWANRGTRGINPADEATSYLTTTWSFASLRIRPAQPRRNYPGKLPPLLRPPRAAWIPGCAQSRMTHAAAAGGPGDSNGATQLRAARASVGLA